MPPVLAQPRHLGSDLLQPLFKQFDFVLRDRYDLRGGRAEPLGLGLAEEPRDERVDARGALRRVVDDDVFDLRLGFAALRVCLRERRGTPTPPEQHCCKNCPGAGWCGAHGVLCWMGCWPTAK